MHACPINNPYQKQQTFPRILFICSAGLLRSPTAAFVASQMGYNTRAAGCEHYALVPTTEQLIAWADKVFVMTEDQKERFYKMNDKVKVLGIKDDYEYRSTELVEQLKVKFKEAGL